MAILYLNVLVLLALPWHIATQSMSQFFTVSPRCSSGGINIDQLLRDTQAILAAGDNACSTLLNSNTFVKQTTRRYMRNMSNPFGTYYYNYLTRSGLEATDRTTVQTVQGIYTSELA